MEPRRSLKLARFLDNSVIFRQGPKQGFLKVGREERALLLSTYPDSPGP